MIRNSITFQKFYKRKFIHISQNYLYAIKKINFYTEKYFIPHSKEIKMRNMSSIRFSPYKNRTNLKIIFKIALNIQFHIKFKFIYKEFFPVPKQRKYMHVSKD